MDRMNATELAANQFRMTQARDKLARDSVRSQQHAIATHNQVGKEVRDAIRRIGGTLPENIPAAEPIKMWRSECAMPYPASSWTNAMRAASLATHETAISSSDPGQASAA